MFFAKVRLYDPQGYTPEGLMFVKPEHLDWDEIPYLEPVECAHQESMCRACRDSWECDYEVQTPSFV